MELRHVSVFVAVAEELHFGRAGQRLHLSQPAVSRLVSQLERELGVTLLARSTRQVCLTPAGTAFLRDARRGLALLDGAAAGARRVALAAPPVLRIGFSECTEEWLPAVLRSMRRNDPEVRVEVRNIDRSTQARQLLTGDIDAALRRAPVEEDAVQTELLVAEPMVVLLPGHHHLAAAGRLRWRDLAECPFVVMPASSAHTRLQSAASGAGIVLRTSEEVTSLASLLVLVSAGAGMALVPLSIARRFRSDDVVYRAVDAPQATLPVLLAWRREHESPAVEGLLAAIRSRAWSPYGPDVEADPQVLASGVRSA